MTKAPARLALCIAAVVACLCAACASTPPAGPSVAPQAAMEMIAIGKSTKADVRAALGDTLTISFDNGYEVWVYRLDRDTTAEFVILFAPSGIVAKTRIRPDPRRA